jgi:hypothetical protein
MPKDFTRGSHCRSPKGILAFIGDCGINWCSQRAALIDTHCLRSAFFGLCRGKKHRDGARHFFLRHPSSMFLGIHLNRILKMGSCTVALLQDMVRYKFE